MSAAASDATAGAKTCACTGVRWCARCLDADTRAAHGLRAPIALPVWLERALATAGERLQVFDPEIQSVPGDRAFAGLRVYPEALSESEAATILRAIEASPFVPSQSGKQKQHYGPRVNFLRRRMNADRFTGLPAWATSLEMRLRERVEADRAGDPDDLAACRAALDAYETTDVFVLRYVERECSNLDLHVDDLFAYGEAILDVSLDSDSTLTFVGPRRAEELERVCVRVPLPARSIAVVYGPARFAWEHAILARDVRGVRTSVTLRTLAPALRDTEAGRVVLARARAARHPWPREQGSSERDR